MASTTHRYFHLPRPISLTTAVDLSASVDSIKTAAARLCDGLTEKQLSWRPLPGKWSIAQNLAHLRTTAEVFLPSVDAAIAKSRSLGLYSDGPFRLRLRGRLLVNQMESPAIIRLRAPRSIRPIVLASPQLELEQFLLAQDAMKQRMQAAEGLDLTVLRFPSPLTRVLRVNLLEFFSAFNAHARRHLRQANLVRQQLR